MRRPKKKSKETKLKPFSTHTPQPKSATLPERNDLYFGDNLLVLRRLVAQNSIPFIDLIYIDPPFNSKRNYNILFENIDMKDANAQKHAFNDTWSSVGYIVELGNIAELNKDLFEFLSMLEKSKSVNSSAVAYLTTMAIRIYYMHRLLKDTGSFYLHCDPTMSHYLKMICDMIFGSKNFQNEIIWKRTFAHSDAKRFSKVSDTILFYSKTERFAFNKIKVEYSSDYVQRYYNNEDKNGRKFALDSLVKPKGSVGYFYTLLGCPPPPNGWRMPEEKAKVWIKEDRIAKPSKGKTPRYKRYIDEVDGLSVTNIWTDLPPINSQAKEALGYPTQKPEALMERIIKSSTVEGDIIADFFCGCGTTIAAAQKLNRKWLGADISHLAVKLILQRLIRSYGTGINEKIKLHGFPKDVDSAKMLARETENGRFGFQEWAIEFLLHGVVNVKKTGDGGYDGYLTYNTEKGKDFVLIETKSGGVNVKNLREFIHVVEKQKAAAGIFVCFKETVSKEMLKEAKGAGTIKISGYLTDIDKIQILTVDDLLSGKMPHLPNLISTFKQAERVETKVKAPTLF